MRPAHVHFLVNAQGYEPLITHVFIEGDEYLDSDAVFGVKDDLISKIEHHDEPVMPTASRRRDRTRDVLRIPDETGDGSRAAAPDVGRGMTGTAQLTEQRIAK